MRDMWQQRVELRKDEGEEEDEKKEPVVNRLNREMGR